MRLRIRDRQRPMAICAGLVVLMVGIPNAPVGAAPEQDTGSVDRGLGLNAAVRFRQSFGLRADSAFVAAAMLNPIDFPNTEWGPPLSDEEAGGLMARVDVQRQARNADAKMAGESDYAGMYIDQLTGGTPIFLTTGRADMYADVLTALIQGAYAFEIRVVNRDLASLESQKAQIVNARDQLAMDGIAVHTVSVHVRDNRVEVGVTNPTEQVLSRLSEFGDDMLVYQDGSQHLDVCGIEACGPRMKGGLAIESDVPNGCTSGYLARRTDGTHNNLGIVTAGHCLYPGGSSSSWLHDFAVIGDENGISQGWQTGSYGDVGFIDLSTAADPDGIQGSNKFLANPSTNQLVNFTSTIPVFLQHEGDAVCRIGWGSYLLHRDTTQSQAKRDNYKGRQCGLITLFDTDSDGLADPDSQSCIGATCKLIHYMKKVDFDSTSGDSGGTVFEPTSLSDTEAALMGTHVHSVTDSASADEGWYSSVSWGITELSVLGYTIEPCLNWGCT